MYEQKVTIKKEDDLLSVLVEGGPQLSQEEKERIKKGWEKPENQVVLEQLIKTYGEFKKVVDQKTGIAYKVPTRIIITQGLNYKDLPNYPHWED